MNDKRCITCIYFNNKDFDNKSYGTCEVLNKYLYVEKDGKVINEDNIVTHITFGCINYTEHK